MPILRIQRAPNLTNAPQSYVAAYHDFLNRDLRVYFNSLDNFTAALAAPFGGQYLDYAYGVFYNTANQTFAAPDTAYPLVFDTTRFSNGISVVNNSEITVETDGIYSVEFTGHLASSNASSKTAYVWLSQEGTGLAYTTQAYTISGNGTEFGISGTFIISMRAGEEMEMNMSVTDTTASLSATSATSIHPGIPAAKIVISYIGPVAA